MSKPKQMVTWTMSKAAADTLRETFETPVK